MDDLNALNQRIQEQGGEVIGINTETLDATRTTLPLPDRFWNRPGLHSATSILTSASDAGKFALGIMPSHYLRCGSSGQHRWGPIMGGIDKEDNAATLQKLIDEALAQSQQ